MTVATMTSKGQLTIPADVRRKLRLRAGDKVRFEDAEDGSVRLVRKGGDIREAKGMFGPADRTVTLEEMNEAVARAVRERDDRSRY
jgi:AbrB family looped-hinge helix DNA binding protein